MSLKTVVLKWLGLNDVYGEILRVEQSFDRKISEMQVTAMDIPARLNAESLVIVATRTSKGDRVKIYTPRFDSMDHMKHFMRELDHLQKAPLPTYFDAPAGVDMHNINWRY